MAIWNSKKENIQIVSLGGHVVICVSYWKSCLLSCVSCSLKSFFSFKSPVNPRWYVRQVDFFLYFQTPRSFQVLERA